MNQTTLLILELAVAIVLLGLVSYYLIRYLSRNGHKTQQKFIEAMAANQLASQEAVTVLQEMAESLERLNALNRAKEVQ